MKINILAFGIARDIVGGFQIPIEMPDLATVADVKQTLIERFPDFQKLASLRVAVNAEYANDSDVLTPNDEIVLIPPVSGG
jgi:molybdopterin converting factor subunit 1